MAESFTKVILDAVETKAPPLPCRTHKLGWSETAEISAAFTIAWNAGEDARQCMPVNPQDRTAGKTLRTACANLRTVIDAGLHAYFEEYLAETERLLADNDQRGFYKHLKGTVGLEVERREANSSLRTRMARY